jgi:hypothetical protein
MGSKAEAQLRGNDFVLEDLSEEPHGQRIWCFPKSYTLRYLNFNTRFPRSVLSGASSRGTLVVELVAVISKNEARLRIHIHRIVQLKWHLSNLFQRWAGYWMIILGGFQ